MKMSLYIISVIAGIVCITWLHIWSCILEPIYRKKTANTKDVFVGSPTKYSSFLLSNYFSKFLSFFQKTGISILGIMLMLFPFFIHLAISLAISGYDHNFKNDHFVAAWGIVVVSSLVIESFIDHFVSRYKFNKIIYNKLIEEAKRRYPDFDTNPETKKMVFEEIAKCDFRSLYWHHKDPNEWMADGYFDDEEEEEIDKNAELDEGIGAC